MVSRQNQSLDELFTDHSQLYKPSTLCSYRFNQNKPSGVLHTYVLNVFSTADCSCATKYIWKTLIEVGSPHLYACFGTFCVQIGQLFVAQWVLKHSEEFQNRRHFPSKTANYRFSNSLTVPRIIDQFGRKDVDYQLL